MPAGNAWLEISKLLMLIGLESLLEMVSCTGLSFSSSAEDVMLTFSAAKDFTGATKAKEKTKTKESATLTAFFLKTIKAETTIIAAKSNKTIHEKSPVCGVSDWPASCKIFVFNINSDILLSPNPS